MYGEYNRQKSFAPVNVGDELELTIEAVGEKGDGIAKVKGFVIFVPNTKQGDVVKVKITKVLRKVGFGEVVGTGSAPAEGASEEGVAEEEPKKKGKKAKKEEAAESTEEEYPKSEAEESSDSEEF